MVLNTSRVCVWSPEFRLEHMRRFHDKILEFTKQTLSQNITVKSGNFGRSGNFGHKLLSYFTIEILKKKFQFQKLQSCDDKPTPPVQFKHVSNFNG